MNSFTRYFLNSCFSQETPSDTIRATFADGRTAVYTMAIFNALTTDQAIIEIMDTHTGEILFCR